MSGARERRQQVGEAWTTWLVTRGQWRSVAACRSADPELFFPISDSGPALEQAAKAKTICATCRVRRECLTFALRTRQLHGIWGGTTEHERAAARRKMLREQPVADEQHPASLSAPGLMGYAGGGGLTAADRREGRGDGARQIR